MVGEVVELAWILRHHALYSRPWRGPRERPEKRQAEEADRSRADAKLATLARTLEQWELGHFEHAVEIAGALRVLLYDKQREKPSLLTQLGLKRIPFVSTPGTQTAVDGTTFRRLAQLLNGRDVGPRQTRAGLKMVWWCPMYHRANSPGPEGVDYEVAWDLMPFDQWWEEPIIANKLFKITRRRLVLLAANELGAMHSAPGSAPIQRRSSTEI